MAKKKETNLEIVDTSLNLDSLKDELKDYITLEIRREYNEEIEKANRRLIKEKNKSLLWKNIFIVLLILVIGFLVYVMYKDGFFNRIFSEDEKIVDVISEKEEEKKEQEKKQEPKKTTFDELKKQYEHLLDNIYINEESDYINNYYHGILSNELKNYLALNLIDFSSLNKEDDYNMFDADTLRIKYNKIFDDTYKSGSFEYDGNEIRYINKIDSYITTSLLEKKKTNIAREIVNITVEEEKVLIETVEGWVKDSSIYNILTNEKMPEEKQLNELGDKLTHLIYTFENGNLTNIQNPNME